MDCLFCSIVAGDIPVDKVFEDEQVYAFRDIAPQGPTHVQVIPKKHIATVNDISADDEQLVGHMLTTAATIAKSEGFADDGYRLVMNTNQHGCQTVFHIHLHLIGGRQMGWPPG
jgi:histidine triad (HIT) family protein